MNNIGMRGRTEKPMAKNDGKSLEQFVAEIEKIAADGNRVVEINKRLYNDNGNQVAEFDIFITIPSEKGAHKWLIECRNRPSQGSAPGNWIEQLIGRKMLHEFERIIAVSTTGFSPAAMHWAEKGGVELRTVSSAEDHPENWLCNYTTVLTRTTVFNGYHINLPDNLSPTTVDLVAKTIERHNADKTATITLLLQKPESLLTPEKLFQNLCFDDSNEIFVDVQPGKSKSVNLKVTADPELIGEIFLIIGDENIPIESINLFGKVRTELSKVPFKQIEISRDTTGNFIGQRMTSSMKINEKDIHGQFYDVQAEKHRKLVIQLNKG